MSIVQCELTGSTHIDLHRSAAPRETRYFLIHYICIQSPQIYLFHINIVMFYVIMCLFLYWCAFFAS